MDELLRSGRPVVIERDTYPASPLYCSSFKRVSILPPLSYYASLGARLSLGACNAPVARALRHVHACHRLQGRDVRRDLLLQSSAATRPRALSGFKISFGWESSSVTFEIEAVLRRRSAPSKQHGFINHFFRLLWAAALVHECFISNKVTLIMTSALCAWYDLWRWGAACKE